MALRQLAAGTAACSATVPSSRSIAPDVLKAVARQEASLGPNGAIATQGFNALEHWDDMVNGLDSVDQEPVTRLDSLADHTLHPSLARSLTAMPSSSMGDAQFANVYPFGAPGVPLSQQPRWAHHHNVPAFAPSSAVISGYVRSFFESLMTNQLPHNVAVTSLPLSPIAREKLRNRAGIYIRHFHPDKVRHVLL